MSLRAKSLISLFLSFISNSVLALEGRERTTTPRNSAESASNLAPQGREACALEGPVPNRSTPTRPNLESLDISRISALVRP